MSGQDEDALEVLRGIWSARNQTSADLDEAAAATRTCKKMADVGFAAMAGSDGDLRAAWRSRLEREGKLSAGGGTLADLVLGPHRPADRA